MTTLTDADRRRLNVSRKVKALVPDLDRPGQLPALGRRGKRLGVLPESEVAPLPPGSSMAHWSATDHILIAYHSPGNFYARNLTLAGETHALGSRDDAWRAVLKAVRCYDNAIFQRASTVLMAVAAVPGGASTTEIGKRCYGGTRKRPQPGTAARNYLRELARMGLVVSRFVRGGNKRWTLTERGKAMLELRRRWDEHRERWGAKEAG